MEELEHAGCSRPHTLRNHKGLLEFLPSWQKGSYGPTGLSSKTLKIQLALQLEGGQVHNPCARES